jgi:hypothetical protein
VLCYSQEQALQVKARLAQWLAPRGLTFNEDKTRVVHLNEGFDLLGGNVRRYGAKLLTKPSKAAIKRLRERLASEMRALRGSNPAAVIAVLTPVVRGWAAYYRNVVSSRVSHAPDTYLWRLTFKWARWQHRNKPRPWIVQRYVGASNRSRNDRWVLGDRDSGGYLVKFSWTGITRHTMVKGTAAPDDPALAGYRAGRRKKVKPPLDNGTLRLLAKQNAECPLCGEHLLTADQLPQSPERRNWGGDRSPAGQQPPATLSTSNPARAAQTPPASCTLPAGADSVAVPAATTPCSQTARPRGSPEPCAATSGTHGSERGPAGQPAGPTRQTAARCAPRPPSTGPATSA